MYLDGAADAVVAVAAPADGELPGPRGRDGHAAVGGIGGPVSSAGDDDVTAAVAAAAAVNVAANVDADHVNLVFVCKKREGRVGLKSGLHQISDSMTPNSNTLQNF